MAGVARSSYCSLPMSKCSSSSTFEKVKFNLPPRPFIEMVGVYVGCAKYCPTTSLARSIQDTKKYKNLMVASSSSQQTVHVQGDNQVSLDFKHLCREGKVKAALQAMDKMEKKGVFLGSIDIVELLKVCVDLKLLEAGKMVHEYVLRSPSKPSSVVFNKLVEMYCGLGDTGSAKKVFEQISDKNLDSWNLMLLGLAENGEGKEALQIFGQMKEAGVRPNGSTFDGVMEACVCLGAVEEGLTHFKSMSRDYSINPTMEHYESIVDLLGRSQKITEAKEIIKNMPIEPSSVVRETLEKYTKTGRTERPGELGSFVSPSGLRLSNKKKIYSGAKDYALPSARGKIFPLPVHFTMSRRITPPQIKKISAVLMQ
ncbi:hypothetical protein Pint_08889 [Pistacia integerrima]|uniref:Uncharacterized protein n=1 Tax=Pistacia integerrima TaxID=434235 RepID=A0ACC0XVD5_9ROSI|nr:hypothetical protein Pint_08889 [Pistacia integerrima]